MQKLLIAILGALLLSACSVDLLTYDSEDETQEASNAPDVRDAVHQRVCDLVRPEALKYPDDC